MSTDFRRVLRGYAAQTVIKVLFEKAGYRVSRIGIEELCPSIIPLNNNDHEEYKQLNIPDALRLIPDIIALDVDPSSFASHLIEVKYRYKFGKNAGAKRQDTNLDLLVKFNEHKEHWSDFYCIILLATPCGKKDSSHNNHIRVVKDSELDKLEKQCNSEEEFEDLWGNLPILADYFLRFKNEEENENIVNAKTMVSLLKALKDLAPED